MIDPEVSLDTVGRLLALIAHDLRNPLSAIHSNLGFLSSTLVDDVESLGGGTSERTDELRDALADGLISCEGLTHMIDNIEIWGQILRGATPPAKAPTAVADLVQDSVSRCSGVAESYGIRLERVRSSPDLARATVFINREQVSKALGNLIRNSIQHSTPGQVVGVGLRWPSQTERTRLHVVVEDGGTPVNPNAAAALFTADGQLQAKSSSEGRYSRALGLYIARLGGELGGARVRAERSSGASPTNTLVLELDVH